MISDFLRTDRYVPCLCTGTGMASMEIGVNVTLSTNNFFFPKIMD
jgi:hypothetical protein